MTTGRSAALAYINTGRSSLARVWPPPSVRLGAATAAAAAITVGNAVVHVTGHLAHRPRPDLLVPCVALTRAVHALRATALSLAPAHARLLRGIFREPGREHVRRKYIPVREPRGYSVFRWFRRHSE
jgi:hypothetical protein